MLKLQNEPLNFISITGKFVPFYKYRYQFLQIFKHLYLRNLNKKIELIYWKHAVIFFFSLLKSIDKDLLITGRCCIVNFCVHLFLKLLNNGCKCHINNVTRKYCIQIILSILKTVEFLFLQKIAGFNFETMKSSQKFLNLQYIILLLQLNI